jgi:hypothetical protein
MAQLRFTVPLNDPFDSNAIVKLAVDAAFMDLEIGEPDIAPKWSKCARSQAVHNAVCWAV